MHLQENLLSVGVPQKLVNRNTLRASDFSPESALSRLLLAALQLLYIRDGARSGLRLQLVCGTCESPPTVMEVVAVQLSFERCDVKTYVSMSASCHVRSAVRFPRSTHRNKCLQRDLCDALMLSSTDAPLVELARSISA